VLIVAMFWIFTMSSESRYNYNFVGSTFVCNILRFCVALPKAHILPTCCCYKKWNSLGPKYLSMYNVVLVETQYWFLNPDPHGSLTSTQKFDLCVNHVIIAFISFAVMSYSYWVIKRSVRLTCGSVFCYRKFKLERTTYMH
jgi:hypothetical protein